MNKQITFREYRASDRESLAAVIRMTWNHDAFCTPKTAKLLSIAYLDICLANQTYTQVALHKGVPVGIIMANCRSKGKRPVKFKIRALISAFRLLISKEGRQVGKFFKGINKIDEELLAGCKKNYAGELSFFAISAEHRGEGIGKELFKRAVEHLNNYTVDSFFLYTDTSCNYGFYEKQDMKRCGEKKISLNINGKKDDLTFFIYEKQLI